MLELGRGAPRGKAPAGARLCKIKARKCGNHTSPAKRAAQTTQFQGTRKTDPMTAMTRTASLVTLSAAAALTAPREAVAGKRPSFGGYIGAAKRHGGWRARTCVRGAAPNMGGVGPIGVDG